MSRDRTINHIPYILRELYQRFWDRLGFLIIIELYLAGMYINARSCVQIHIFLTRPSPWACQSSLHDYKGRDWLPVLVSPEKHYDSRDREKQGKVHRVGGSVNQVFVFISRSSEYTHHSKRLSIEQGIQIDSGGSLTWLTSHLPDSALQWCEWMYTHNQTSWYHLAPSGRFRGYARAIWSIYRASKVNL
jgi:hypothetical protein